MTNDQIPSANQGSSRKYDLADRTRKFAQDVRAFVAQLHRNIATIEDCKQLIRSSGSIGANYLEADEALSPRDFRNRIKICRKESRESHYWLHLLDRNLSDEQKKLQRELLQESREFVLIFNAIIRKTQIG